MVSRFLIVMAILAAFVFMGLAFRLQWLQERVFQSEPPLTAERLEALDLGGVGEPLRPAPGSLEAKEAWPPASEPLAAGETGALAIPFSGNAPLLDGKESWIGNPMERFVGLVVSSADASPVPSAVVKQGEDPIATSDHAGRFEVRYHRDLPLMVSVQAHGYGVAYTWISASAHDREHRLRLDPAASVGGRVLCGDGSGAAGVPVLARVPADELLQTDGQAIPAADVFRLADPLWRAVTDGEGGWRIEGLPARIVELSFGRSSPDGAEWGERSIGPASAAGAGGDSPVAAFVERVALAAGDRIERDWREPAPVAVDGRVVDQYGRPAADAAVWLVRPEAPSAFRPATESVVVARTDRRGTFRFDQVPDGTWELRAPAGIAEGPDAGTAQIAAEPVRFEVQRGRQQDELVLEVWRDLTIRGRVLDPHGEGPEDLLVTAIDGLGARSAQAATMAGGGFAVGPLTPGSYHLEVQGDPRFAAQSFGPFAAGSEGHALRLCAGATIGGVVVDAESGEPAAARVELFPASRYARRACSALAGDDGRFLFADVERGAYHLVATTGDSRIGLLELPELSSDASAQGWQVALHRGGHVRVLARGGSRTKRVVLLREGRPVAAHDITRLVPRELLAPEGRILVRISVSSQVLAEREVDVRAGSVLDVEFDLE